MSFLASDDTADWLRETLKKWLAKSARLAKLGSVERIRQLNRGQALVFSATLDLIERARREGKPLNLQLLHILAENFAEKSKRETRDELRGRKSAAHRVIKIVRWHCFSPIPGPHLPPSHLRRACLKMRVLVLSMLCLLTDGAQAGRNSELRERPQPATEATPTTCDPKDPAACDGCPSRCYCPQGSDCTCVTRT